MLFGGPTSRLEGFAIKVPSGVNVIGVVKVAVAVLGAVDVEVAVDIDVAVGSGPSPSPLFLGGLEVAFDGMEVALVGVVVTVEEGVLVAVIGDDVDDGDWGIIVGLVGVALGFNTTSGTTLVSVTDAPGVRNVSAHAIGVRISERTGAIESGRLFESRSSLELTFEEISAETRQLGIR